MDPFPPIWRAGAWLADQTPDLGNLMKGSVVPRKDDLTSEGSEKKQTEKKSRMRQPQGIWDRILALVAGAFVLFHVYTAYMGPFPNLRQRAIHVCFALILVFAFMRPLGRKVTGSWRRLPIIADVVFMIITIISCVYVVVDYHWIMEHPAEITPFQMAVGLPLLVLVLEAGRRTVGILFPLLTSIFIIYAVGGQYIPDIPIIGKYLAYWGHRGFSFEHIIQVLYLSDKGIWGFVTGISSTLVAIFIIFGGVLLATGQGETFMDLAICLTGRFYGGAAKVSTLASGFFGMMSGSAVANVVTTGNFTIPLMKRLKYGKEFAAGVEATASTGGQITPPIMGAGAFLMAEFLEMPYISVAIAACIPAFLFYTAVFSAIHIESHKRQLVRLPSEEIKPLKQVLKPSRSIPLFIPIIILISLMLNGHTPEWSAFWATISFAGIFTFSTLRPAEIKERFSKLVKGMRAIADSLMKIVPLLVCANVIVSLISLTGLSVNMSELIISISGQNILLALGLAALVALILGMGIPTPAAYLLGASVVAPSLSEMGFAPLAAHMFIFYFAILSAITPPVCAGVYVASGIAGSDWLKTSWVAIRLSLVTYILPFVFIFNTSLLMQGATGGILWSLFICFMGVLMLAAGIMGYLFVAIPVLVRLGFVVGAFLCLSTDPVFGSIGMLLGISLYLYQRYCQKKLEVNA